MPDQGNGWARSKVFVPLEPQSHLFARLPHRGVPQVPVGGAGAATRQRHLTGPGIARMGGALNEAQAELTVGAGEEQGHRGVLGQRRRRLWVQAPVGDGLAERGDSQRSSPGGMGGHDGDSVPRGFGPGAIDSAARLYDARLSLDGVEERYAE